jgi:O-antigen/teichoic acid export membrane protein
MYNLQQARTLLTFGFLQSTGQVLGMIAPLVAAKYFSGGGSPEAVFGSYSLSATVLFFFMAVLISSTQSPFIVHANQEREKTGRINKSFTAQCLFFVAGIALFLILNAAFAGVTTAFAEISRGELAFVSVAFVGMAIKAFFSNVFMALGKRERSALVELVFGTVVMAVVIVVLCRTGRITIDTVFSAYGLGGLAVAVVFIGAVDFGVCLPLDFDRSHFRAMLHFTSWLMFGAALTALVNWGDNLVLTYYKGRHILSLGNIGAYNFAYSLFKGVAMLMLIVHVYFLPFVSQHIANAEKMKSYLFNKRPKILALGVACIALLYVVLPAAREAIYGKLYEDSIAPLRVLLLGCVLVLYVIFYETILYARKSYRFVQVLNIVQLSVNLSLDILLVPMWGILGAAVGTVIGYLIRTVVMELYFNLKLKKVLY